MMPVKYPFIEGESKSDRVLRLSREAYRRNVQKMKDSGTYEDYLDHIQIRRSLKKNPDYVLVPKRRKKGRTCKDNRIMQADGTYTILEDTKARNRRNNLWKSYGITPEQFDEMLLNQGNACKICKRSSSELKRMCVDHCHNSKKIRGILCERCNFGIGHFRDSIQFLSSAITYLEEASA